MANIEVSFSNFYESKLGTGGLPQSVESCVVDNAPTYDGTNQIPTPFYLVIDPDNASAREVIKVTAAVGTSFTTVVRDIEGRYGTAEDASSAPSHSEDTVVRMAVVGEMFEDVHDRIDAIPAFPITLGTNTNGNYVLDVSAGNGLTKTSSASEGQTVDLVVDINGATDGTAITVDGASDLLLLYDADTGTVKKVYSNQVGGSGVSMTSANGFFMLNG